MGRQVLPQVLVRAGNDQGIYPLLHHKLAHSLGMTVCAEGIEDEAAFRFLKTIECDKMQGFLISEAVMPKLLRKVYGPGAEGKVA